MLQETVSFCFFPSKSKQNYRKVVLSLSYSKANKDPTPPTKPNQASPRHHLLHLQVAATCSMSGVRRYAAFFFSSLQLLQHKTPEGRNYGPHRSLRTEPVVNNHVLLTHRGPQPEHLSPGSCEGGRSEWPCSPQLKEGAVQAKFGREFYAESIQKSMLELGTSSLLFG